MLKIGLLGSDNSHAERFSEMLNCPEHPAFLMGADAQIVGIWGEDAERTRQVAASGHIPQIIARPEEMLGQVDAVICVTRHGGLHLPLTRPYLAAGVPTFIDKPLAVDPADARALVELAQAKKVPFTSFSTVRFAADGQAFLDAAGGVGKIRAGTYTGPATRRNIYGGLVFYAIHSVELMLATQGTGVQWVEATEGPAVDDQGNGSVVVVCAWTDGSLATLELTADAHYGFRALAIGTQGATYADLDISDCYREGMRRILAVLHGGESPVPLPQMVEAIQVCQAMELSLQRGARVELKEV
jgi:predicted dehydrogenase